MSVPGSVILPASNVCIRGMIPFALSALTRGILFRIPFLERALSLFLNAIPLTVNKLFLFSKIVGVKSVDSSGNDEYSCYYSCPLG